MAKKLGIREKKVKRGERNGRTSCLEFPELSSSYKYHLLLTGDL